MAQNIRIKTNLRW